MSREEKIKREAESYMDDFGTFVEAVGEISANDVYHTQLEMVFSSLKNRDYELAGIMFHQMFEAYCYWQAEDVYEKGKL